MDNIIFAREKQMSDSKKGIDTRPFSKTDYRPWNDTLDDSASANPSFESNIPELDYVDSLSNNDFFSSDSLEHIFASTSNTYPSEINAQSYPLENQSKTDEHTSFEGFEGFDEVQAVNPHATQEKMDTDRLKSTIRYKTREQEKLAQELAASDKGSVSFGGFLKSNNKPASEGTENHAKIQGLKQQLFENEKELANLTSSLKISQAQESVHQAELARQFAEDKLKSVEKRMSHAIEQANLAVKRLHEVMEKVKITEQAQAEEENLRHLAESKIEDARVRATSAEMNLESERKSRTAAENKAESAVNQSVQAELARQQLDETCKQQRLDLEEQRYKINALENDLKQKHKENQELTHSLESVSKTNDDYTDDLTSNRQALQQYEAETKNLKDKLDVSERRTIELAQQQEKLKKLIDTEREVRRLAEKKMKDAIASAQQAEQERNEAVRQKELIDERAKRAVAHASKTVMQFLDTSEEIMSPAKKRVKIQADTKEMEE